MYQHFLRARLIFKLDCSPKYKNFILLSLKQIFLFARKYHGLNKDFSVYSEYFPTTSEELSSQKKRFENIWTQEQFNHLLLEVVDDMFKLAFIMMFKNGLRVGEVLALQWRCIDFEKNTVLIDGSITKKTEKYAYERKSVKTKNSERTILISTITMNRFKALFDASEGLYGFNEMVCIR